MRIARKSAEELDDLKCPITLELFRDPVRAGDGHTYEREPITEWILANGTSPLTRQPLRIEDLTTDERLKNRAARRRNSTVIYQTRTDIVTLPSIPTRWRQSRAFVFPRTFRMPRINCSELLSNSCLQWTCVIGCSFIILLAIVLGLVLGTRSMFTGLDVPYPSNTGWSDTNYTPSIRTAYSGQLSWNSTTFSRTGNGSFYYAESRIKVNVSAEYFLLGRSTFKACGYLYIDSFNTSNLSNNLLAEKNCSSANASYVIKIPYQLSVNSTYILIVTTYRANDTGAFDIYAYGPAKINFF